MRRVAGTAKHAAAARCARGPLSLPAVLQMGCAGEGEWADMQNVSPRAFPCFAPREQRAVVKQLTAPSAMAARDALVWVDGSTLYINDKAVTGLTLSTAAGMTPKELVSMGAYLIVLPDKKYVNTANLTEYGSIESNYNFEGDVVYSPARIDGSNIDLSGVPATVEPPTDPANKASPRSSGWMLSQMPGTAGWLSKDSSSAWLRTCSSNGRWGLGW